MLIVSSGITSERKKYLICLQDQRMKKSQRQRAPAHSEEANHLRNIRASDGHCQACAFTYLSWPPCTQDVTYVLITRWNRLIPATWKRKNLQVNRFLILKEDPGVWCLALDQPEWKLKARRHYHTWAKVDGLVLVHRKHMQQREKWRQEVIYDEC